jgi:hypothetical protein
MTSGTIVPSWLVTLTVCVSMLDISIGIAKIARSLSALVPSVCRYSRLFHSRSATGVPGETVGSRL